MRVVFGLTSFFATGCFSQIARTKPMLLPTTLDEERRRRGALPVACVSATPTADRPMGDGFDAVTPWHRPWALDSTRARPPSTAVPACRQPPATLWLSTRCSATARACTGRHSDAWRLTVRRRLGMTCRLQVFNSLSAISGSAPDRCTAAVRSNDRRPSDPNSLSVGGRPSDTRVIELLTPASSFSFRSCNYVA